MDHLTVYQSLNNPYAIYELIHSIYIILKTKPTSDKHMNEG